MELYWIKFASWQMEPRRRVCCFTTRCTPRVPRQPVELNVHRITGEAQLLSLFNTCEFRHHAARQRGLLLTSNSPILPLIDHFEVWIDEIRYSQRWRRSPLACSDEKWKMRKAADRNSPGKASSQRALSTLALTPSSRASPSFLPSPPAASPPVAPDLCLFFLIVRWRSVSTNND